MSKGEKFKPDNRESLKHGAFSNNAVIPADLEKELENYKTFIFSQPQISEADIIIVNQVLQQVKMTRLMERWAEANGGYFLVDELGNLIPKACFNSLYVSLQNSLARNLDRLGMTPKSRQDLGLTKQKRDFIHWLNEKGKGENARQAADQG